MTDVELVGNQKISQSQTFLDEEADNWYSRNESKLRTEYSDSSIETIFRSCNFDKVAIRRILEVGCANAVKLEKLTQGFNAQGFGIDPSKLAIESGKDRLSDSDLDIQLQVGISTEIPYPDESFDLVFLGFFLYLVDRNELEKTMSETHRVLRPGGYLVIEDFDFGSSVVRDYVHNSKIKTYKENYPKLFAEKFSYQLIEKHSYSHFGDEFSKNPEERVATSVLYKSELL